VIGHNEGQKGRAMMVFAGSVLLILAVVLILIIGGGLMIWHYSNRDDGNEE
jgi:hypothetical protein